MVPITEKLLQSAAGWQVFKEAKYLASANRVLEVVYKPPVIKGKVGAGGKTYFSGLKINSVTDMENLCSCPDSRSRGILCAHSIAVALATLQQSKSAPSVASHSSVGTKNESTRPNLSEEIPKAQITVEGSLNHLEANVRFSYSDPSTRNPIFEVQVLNALTESGFEQKRDGLRLDGEKKILQFLLSTSDKLKSLGEFVQGERIRRLTENMVRVEPRLAIRDTNLPGVFDANLSFVAGKDALFSASDIQRLLQGGKNHFTLKNGKTAVVDEEAFQDLEEVIRDCDPEQRQTTYRIKKVYQRFLQESVNGASSADAKKAGKGTNAAKRPLGTLASQLREYQIEGAQWLLDLAGEGFGGILADEMGLGKTIQAIAMLEVVGGPSLVVCPSSLVENWRREICRFLPGIRILVVEGPDREPKFTQIPDYPVILTSYALLQRDIEKYQTIDFKLVILDEAQHIKNPDSQNAKSALKLRSTARFILTGTPLENSIRDIWSLMEFALPGYLGKRKDFKERYEEPVSSGDLSALKRLGRRIGPFLKRRTKENVLTDLPEKIEQVIYCKLTNNQKSTYFQLQNHARNCLIDATSGNQLQASRMAVFTAILRLRQACCDLRLLGSQAVDPASVSGKLQALREILQEAQDGGHKVLVFSQFAEMLKLIRSQCNTDGLEYCYLDGSTKDRMSQVDRFQTNPSIPVFLISLKAGGVGLNLTAADTVIHFDPWWNPAVEAQATDRAHRIGQTKTVNVLKLVAEGTIEERVLALQKQKRELIGAALDSDNFAANTNLETLRELLN